MATAVDARAAYGNPKLVHNHRYGVTVSNVTRQCIFGLQVDNAYYFLEPESERVFLLTSPDGTTFFTKQKQRVEISDAPPKYMM